MLLTTGDEEVTFLYSNFAGSESEVVNAAASQDDRIKRIAAYGTFKALDEAGVTHEIYKLRFIPTAITAPSVEGPRRLRKIVGYWRPRNMPWQKYLTEDERRRFEKKPTREVREPPESFQQRLQDQKNLEQIAKDRKERAEKVVVECIVLDEKLDGEEVHKSIEKRRAIEMECTVDDYAIAGQFSVDGSPIEGLWKRLVYMKVITDKVDEQHRLP